MTQTLTKSPVAGIEPILAAFDRFDHSHEPSWLRTLRESGIAHFAEQGFPTTRNEEWKFTDVRPIAKFPFQIASSSSSSKEIESFQPHLGRYARAETNPFVALNTAFFANATLIHIPKNKVVTEPIRLIFNAETGAAVHPRILVIAEENSQAQIIEHYTGTSGSKYFTNAVTEIVVGENAVVEHCKIQDESPDAFHVATIQAQLARNSNFTSHSISFGARIARNNINLVMTGEGVNCVLNGLYLAKGKQLVDHHTVADHVAPHCNSHEFYHGILDDRSRGVFNGKIFVRQAAQKTDAKQTNRNLLLSREALVDTKPQLEIFADDVKCTHGATIGQLDDQAIFYLRTRGIGFEQARRILTLAFASDIINRIKVEAVRTQLNQELALRLAQATKNDQ